MKVLYLGFDQPVDFGAGGSSNYYSAQKHPGCTVTEEGPWIVIRHRPSRTQTRVPVTNIPYLREPWDEDAVLTIVDVDDGETNEQALEAEKAIEDLVEAVHSQKAKGGRKLP